YVWHMGEGVPYQFYVRVEAADQAGNVGHDDTRQAVKVDLALPKARVITVEPAPVKALDASPAAGSPDTPPAPPPTGPGTPPPPPTPMNSGASPTMTSSGSR